MESLRAAIKSAVPGDEIIMANGTWENAEIRFVGTGREDAPITLRAEENGKVILSGQSNLRLSGEYLVVSGLVFKRGYTPTSAVIEYRTSSKDLAHHCRVTNCVIDDYSNPERFDVDSWVLIFGKNNRFDHNSLIDKRNLGVTLAVRLKGEENQENGHIIDYNYFGPRQNLGANGGETIRIGTSHYSLSYSNTVVSNNYFDRCDGEHEIISNKSCGNIYRDNVFDQCRGTLTMRHGHYTLVENNYLLGRGKPNTGGIRVINKNQTVRNNYLSEITGYRFRGALVVMNGVPNSPLNRYGQVVDSKIENNILVDCDHIQLCAGSDTERSAVPVGTSISGNLILSKTNLNPFTIYDDVSGIKLENNIINDDAEVPFKTGFKFEKYEVESTGDGLKVPTKKLLKRAGLDLPRLPVEKVDVGADYYTKDWERVEFRSGELIAVPPGTNTILEAYNNSNAGDVLVLENGGEYPFTKHMEVRHTVTIRTKSGEKARISSEKESFFRIVNGGSLELDNLLLDGYMSPDMAGNSVVSTSKYSMNQNYKLFVRDCDIRNLDVNHSFNFLKVFKNTFADTIRLENSSFKNITGAVLHIAEETEDIGRYNVEHVQIADCRFEQVQGAVAFIYRGGTDESTFGPIVSLEGNKFNECGMGVRNKVGASVKFHGVQNLSVENCSWTDSAPLNIYLTNGEPITLIKDCVFERSGSIEYNRAEFERENIEIIN
ncbi:polysaccharide lyase 6 family protein [Marinoscillum sp. MHG1-6]|uniref:polysaccharide lyase 6 family protein n=1 Tax=Marinoscillum sp. MHG1-6 TaxID=2959627 RepID=UPI002158254A|nr:polysaccharide lyase 6 family protein [Marinoscillum sp. MHG1-6]